MGISVVGAREAALHGASQYGHGRPQVVPGKGGRCSSGQGNVDSWEVRCKADPSRAGPGSSSVREQREGERKCAVSRFDRAVP